MKKVLFLLTIFFVIAVSAQSRLLLDSQEMTWTSGIGKQCQSVCSSSLVFASIFGTMPASYSCRINLDNGTKAVGSQTSSGVCTANVDGNAVTSSNYDCGCLAPSSIPGLGPSKGGSCSNACLQVAGASGTAISDDSGSLCVASSEIGMTNHFGLATSGECSFVGADGSATSSNAFSCVCSFDQSSVTGG